MLQLSSRLQGYSCICSGIEITGAVLLYYRYQLAQLAWCSKR
nr:MAG TPA: hypothetical protein [Caudoviricetes sp.]